MVKIFGVSIISFYYQIWSFQIAPTWTSKVEIIYDDLQVSSAVPEGKGVSSSASVEVASMSAIAAAHGSYSFHLYTSICITMQML